MKFIAVLLLAVLPICAFSADFGTSKLTTNERGYLFEIHGSNTIGAVLAPNLIESWLKFNNFTNVGTNETRTENEKIIIGTSPAGQKVKIFIAAHGSGTGFKQAANNNGDIAAASRPIKSSENELFPTKDLTDYKYESIIAIDGLAVIINPRLPIDTLTIEQVGQLFSGQVKNWKDIGGPDLPVKIHSRDDKSGTYDTFSTLVLKRGYKLSDTAKRYESNSQLSNTVAKEPGSIGFTAFATIGTAKAVKIKDGESEAMQPSHSTIATEDYPLSRRLYLYQPSNKNPYATEFIQYVKSSNGQTIVNDVGFISQNLETITMKPLGDLPSGYSFIIEQSLRVTTNIRFKNNSYDLDNKAIDDIKRLSDFMAQPENSNKKLILIGFSNQKKNAFSAQILSEARVMKVKSEFNKINIKASAMTGYGQLKPVATNEDVKYALRNQRVEVWIR